MSLPLTNSPLHVDVLGTGQPLVLLHGWGMNGSVWQPLVKKLGKLFSLHVVDLPGMGFSRPVTPYHLHTLADKIAEAMPPQADVVGWSLGGQVAMRLALDYPDMVRRLVLVGSTPCFVNKLGWDNGINPEVFSRFAESVDSDYHKTMAQFLTLQCMGAKDARDTVKVLRKKLAERPIPSTHNLQAALQVLLESDLRAEIHYLRKPTLLVHGDRDTLAPVQAAHWMMQNLPAGFLRVIAGASHAPFLSHQEAFIEAIVQFLEPVQVA